MQKYIYNLGIVDVPKIYSYDKKTKRMVIQRIFNMNISDFYGEESKHISKALFKKIRNIIKTLYLNNIEYVDITGYNFIEYEDKIWVIDFEHAKYIPFERTKNEFLQNFMKGYIKTATIIIINYAEFLIIK